MFLPVPMLVADSTAVAIHVQIPIFEQKSQNRVEVGYWDGVKKWLGTCPGVP